MDIGKIMSSDKDIEETFLKLKKISFAELSYIINDLDREVCDSLIHDSIAIEEFLNTYGWRSDEFDRATQIDLGYMG